jgi:hypothetical protein
MLSRPSDDLISDMFRRMHKAASGTVTVTQLAGTHRGQCIMKERPASEGPIKGDVK